MAANVTYIPPKAAKPEALRVAAYCRVSSDSSDQLHSEVCAAANAGCARRFRTNTKA